MIFKISYFYQIRFFKENQIPISTAKWDPLWYHKNTRNNSLTFRDKNNVINGLRMECLAPGKSCDNLCRGNKECSENPDNCLFLKNYNNQLKSIDINTLLNEVDTLLNKNNVAIDDHTEIIFIVYETPFNRCSERQTIINYFKNNGIEISEFKRS